MADERAGGSLKVSVVVPVYNPGAALDRSVASILAQTMPDDAFEAIFVDDGSTDGSGQRLDEIAAAHRHISVVHIAASGGPSRPRNIGVQRARGEYVQFLDADDRLGERALDLLYEMGRRNGSDIVIGKLVSNFRGVHWGMFQRSYESCTVATAPLIENLTVSKMFRAAFIRENGIAFPEGLRLTEDQYFVVLAYLRAKVVSVLADEPCYFYCGRDDGGNLSSEPLRPAEYCGNLRRILDMIMTRSSRVISAPGCCAASTGSRCCRGWQGRRSSRPIPPTVASCSTRSAILPWIGSTTRFTTASGLSTGCARRSCARAASMISSSSPSATCA